MQSRRRKAAVHTISALLYPLVLCVGTAIGIGQYRRVTSDAPHDIDRFYKMLAPLRERGMESLSFSGPQGRLEAIPQARLVMAPCLLIDFGDDATVKTMKEDTTLAIWPKELSWKLTGKAGIWSAEDEVYRYLLLVPDPF